MRRTLIASLMVAAAAGVLLTQTAFSEGPQTGGVRIGLASAAEPVAAAEGPRERAAHFVEVAQRYAEILAADELEQEIAALERKLTEARAARQLRGIRTELERVVQEFPDTEAAKAATRMLQPSGGNAPFFENPALVPQYVNPSRSGKDDVFQPSPGKP